MYDFNIYGGFSARPAYQIKLYTRRDLTDWANNRSSYAWALYAEKISSGTTWTADPQPWNVQVGSDNFSGSHHLDFRSTNSILLASNTTNYFNHDGNGYLNITVAANVLAAGGSLFGNAYASGTFPTDRIPKAPAAPTMQGTTNITTDSYQLNFYGNDDGGSAIQGWQIQYAENSGFTVGSGVVTNDPGDGTATIHFRDDNTTYYNRVRGWNNASGGITYGAWGSTVAVTTLLADTAPAAPGMSGITSVSWDRMTVNWYANSNGGSPVTSTRLELSTSPSFTSPIVVTNPSTSQQITGLNDLTTYYARVRQVNAIGTSAWSSTVSATTTATPTAPEAPTLNSLTAVGPDRITVTYTQNGNGGSPVTGGTLQYATNAAFTGASTAAGSGSPRIVTGLNDGTEYWFRFNVTNAWGTSPWSNVLSATTLAAIFVGKSGSFQYTEVYVGKNGAYVLAEVLVGSGGTYVSPT